MRVFPFYKNSALIDSEGIPISFAIKSREYKTKPAMIGSKTNALSFVSSNLSNDCKISVPLIQFLFFKKIALIFINLQVANLFLLMDIKGWPPKGNDFAEYFDKLNKLVPQLITTEKNILGMLDDGEDISKKDVVKIPSTYLNKITTNVNYLSRVKLDYKTQVESAEVFPDYFIASIQQEEIKSLSQFCVFNDNNESIYKTNETTEDFCESAVKFLNGNLSETAKFNYGDLIWTLNIFKNNETLVTAPLGKIKQYLVSVAILADDYGEIKQILNLIYKMNKGMSQHHSSFISELFKDSLEILYLPPTQLKKIIEMKIKEKKTEDSLELMERVANYLVQSLKYSEAGDYYQWMADLNKNEGEVQAALDKYLIAAESHVKGKNYTKSGDSYFQIAQIHELRDAKPEAFEKYNLAIENYKKDDDNKEKIREIKDSIRHINKFYKDEIGDYLNKSDGTSFRLEHLTEKFSIERNYLITVLKSLLKQKQITGQLNVLKERYTKEIIGTGGMIIESPEDEVKKIKAMNVSKAPSIKADKKLIISEKGKLDEVLNNFEGIFEQINLPFEKYIEYQDHLSKNQFLEQQMKILDSEGGFMSSSGTPEKCIICLDEFSKTDEIVTCSKKHGYHVNCYKLWIKTQDTCPGDGTNLIPFSLNVSYIDTINDAQDIAYHKNSIAELKERLKAVEKELDKTKEKLLIIESVDKEQKSMFEKFLKEKDLRQEYEKDARKKELMIKELKGILEMIPKSLTKSE